MGQCGKLQYSHVTRSHFLLSRRIPYGSPHRSGALIVTELASACVMTERDDRLDAVRDAHSAILTGRSGVASGGPGWPPVFLKVVRQLASAASSVAANLRTVRRARSTREFAAKPPGGQRKIDEAVHWLEKVSVTNTCLRPDKLFHVLREGRELRAMFAKARKTTKGKL